MLGDRLRPPWTEPVCRRITDYERGLNTTPRVLRSAGRTRAFAAFYRLFGPKADPWLFHKTRGRAALRIGFPEVLHTTTGAKSGLPRAMPLIYVRDGDDFMVRTNFANRTTPAGPRACWPTRTLPSRWGPSGCR